MISIRNESFTEYPQKTSLILLFNHYLVTCIRLDLLFIRYLKGMFSFSCHSWEALGFLESFTSKLTSFNLKMAFMSPIRVKRFFTFKESYLKCYI